VTVACEPTGHRWRVLGQLAADRGMRFVCVQTLQTERARLSMLGHGMRGYWNWATDRLSVRRARSHGSGLSELRRSAGRQRAHIDMPGDNGHSRKAYPVTARVKALLDTDSHRGKRCCARPSGDNPAVHLRHGTAT
jgi:hypothetical protein